MTGCRRRGLKLELMYLKLTGARRKLLRIALPSGVVVAILVSARAMGGALVDELGFGMSPEATRSSSWYLS